MDRNGFLTVMFLFLIVADVSDASFAGQFRKVLGLPQKDNSTTAANSTVSSPVSGGKEKKHEKVNADEPNKVESKDTQIRDNSSKVDPKGSNNTVPVSPPTDKEKTNEKNHQGKENSDNKSYTKTGTSENCDRLSNRCTDQKKMVACIQAIQNGSKQVVLLVQNEGESTLTVNLSIPTSLEYASKELTVPKHKTEKINISLSIGGTTKIMLNAGDGDCLLHMGPVPEESIFNRLPSYTKLVTPIYGAYLLAVAVLIVGGSWACCMFRKKRRLDEVPYQELEMGFPEALPATHAETAEGWDQGWDDDWDEDKAVKSPGAQHVGNISGNGLTSRSSNRDGWEMDWDD